MKKVVQFVIVFSFLFIATGCFNNKSDNSINEVVEKSDLETTYLDKPSTGRPKSQTKMDNIFIALNSLNNASYYESESSGEVIAKKSVKLTTQSVKNRRIITPSASFNESISISTFVKVAEQLYMTNDTILKRDASSVSDSGVSWKNGTNNLSQEQYKKDYGYSFKNPSRYVINEKTIISDIEVLNNGIGRKYTYKFSLDPKIAPYYYKTSIKKLSGSTSEPHFNYINMTITFDYKWRISKIETVEEYKITLGGLGVVTCTATLTENIRNINKSLNISESSFFNKYL